MNTIAQPASPTVAAGHRDTPLLRRPRRSLWPYAGLVSGAAAFGSVTLLAQGQEQFKLDNSPTPGFVVDHLHNATWIKLGGGAAMLSVVAGLVFLLGLARFVESLAPSRRGVHKVLRVSTTAFVATASVGVMMRYIVAGGAEGGIDKNLYTHDSVATLSALGDQLACASYLPVLIAMAVVGFVGFRDRLLARPVGIAAMALAAGSTAATLVLGLPYSSVLVYSLFGVIVGLNGIFSRRAV